MKFDKLFENYFNTAKQVVGKTTTRQQSPRMGATPWRQGSQNIVPDRDRVDPTLNPKVEKLRNKPTGKEYVTAADLQYIIPKYDLRNLTASNPKFLGKSGIKVYWDEQVGMFVLEK